MKHIENLVSQKVYEYPEETLVYAGKIAPCQLKFLKLKFENEILYTAMHTTSIFKSVFNILGSFYTMRLLRNKHDGDSYELVPVFAKNPSKTPPCNDNFKIFSDDIKLIGCKIFAGVSLNFSSPKPAHRFYELNKTSSNLSIPVLQKPSNFHSSSTELSDNSIHQGRRAVDPVVNQNNPSNFEEMIMNKLNKLPTIDKQILGTSSLTHFQDKTTAIEHSINKSNSKQPPRFKFQLPPRPTSNTLPLEPEEELVTRYSVSSDGNTVDEAITKQSQTFQLVNSNEFNEVNANDVHKSLRQNCAKLDFDDSKSKNLLSVECLELDKGSDCSTPKSGSLTPSIDMKFLRLQDEKMDDLGDNYYTILMSSNPVSSYGVGSLYLFQPKIVCSEKYINHEEIDNMNLKSLHRWLSRRSVVLTKYVNISLTLCLACMYFNPFQVKLN